jgi:hypothetical protein
VINLPEKLVIQDLIQVVFVMAENFFIHLPENLVIQGVAQVLVKAERWCKRGPMFMNLS